ncbi:MAG: hypothetical protein EKK42_20270 [Pseudonocardiaceae bacterium]|nr:MAG: hypothetical protein EKK42_20270 [Pseudonocardiaceae bacterium]
MINPAADRDDAVQEAMLQVWKVSQDRERSVTYLQGVAYKSVAEFARSRRHTGNDRKCGYNNPVDPLRRRNAWFDPRAAGLPDHEVDEMYGYTPHRVPDPYERDRIHAAVKSLAPHHRAQVFSRFWLGETLDQNAHVRWIRTIRPKLRAFLSA